MRWNGNESTNATARFPSTWNAAIPKSPRMGSTPVGRLHLQILYAGYCIVQLLPCSYHCGYEPGNHSKYCTFDHFRVQYAFRQAQIPRPLLCSRGARHDKSRSYSNSPCSHFVVAANDLGLIRRNTDFHSVDFGPWDDLEFCPLSLESRVGKSANSETHGPAGLSSVGMTGIVAVWTNWCTNAY